MSAPIDSVNIFLDRYGLSFEKNFGDLPASPYINKNKSFSFDIIVDQRERWNFPINVMPKAFGLYIVSTTDSYISLRIRVGSKLIYNVDRLRPGIYDGFYVIGFGNVDYENEYETFTVDISLWNCAYGVNCEKHLAYVFYYSNYTPKVSDRLRLFFYYASKIFCKNESEVGKAMEDQLGIQCASKYIKALSQALAYISEAPFDYGNLPESIQTWIGNVNRINQLSEELSKNIEKNLDKLTKANSMMEEFSEKSIQSNEEIEKEIQLKLLRLKNLEDKISELTNELENYK